MIIIALHAVLRRNFVKSGSVVHVCGKENTIFMLRKKINLKKMQLPHHVSDFESMKGGYHDCKSFHANDGNEKSLVLF